MRHHQAGIGNGNALRLGIFGANCSSGRTYAILPERWQASWENNLKLAQLADAIGIECMIPIARWKGYGGESNPNGSSFESIAWACGLLAATQRISVFCTVHVPLHHPVAAAKQMATTDHIGHGRLGVNIVCGWNEDEFQMFGMSPHEHAERYAQGEEWWSIVKRIWAGEAPFDYEGTYYQLRGVQGLPRPYGTDDPLMMNAGSSPAGRQFAIRHSDMHFDSVDTLEASLDRIAETKQQAIDNGIWKSVGWWYQNLAQFTLDWEFPNLSPEERDATFPLLNPLMEGNVPIDHFDKADMIVVGDPDECLTKMKHYADLGVDQLICYVQFGYHSNESVLKTIELLGKEVIPELEKYKPKKSQYTA